MSPDSCFVPSGPSHWELSELNLLSFLWSGKKGDSTVHLNSPIVALADQSNGLDMKLTVSPVNVTSTAMCSSFTTHCPTSRQNPTFPKI